MTQLIKEMWEVDQEVEKSNQRRVNLETEKTMPNNDVFTELWKVDKMFGGATEKGSGSTSPTVPNDNESYDQGTSFDNEHEQALSQVSELLSTDLEVDGRKKLMETTRQALDALYQVDQEVESGMPSIAADFDSGIADPESIEELVKSRKEQLALDLEREKKRAKEYRDSLMKELMKEEKVPLEESVGALYATDLQVDECTDVIKHKDDVEAIMDLYDIDCQVDRAKQSSRSVESVMQDILTVDRIVDKLPPKENTDFVDHMAVKYLKQKLIDSKSLVHQDNGVTDVWDLLQTDMEIDNKKGGPLTALRDVLSLLEVDQQIDNRKSLSSRHETKKVTNVIASVESTSQKQATVEGVIQKVKKLPLPEDILGLYATDLEVDGCSAINQERDTTKALIDLHEMDLEVDQAKKRPTATVHGNESKYFEDLLTCLYQTDQRVDRQRQDQSTIEFVDPIHQSLIRQHHQETQSMVHRYEGVAEVSSLLSTDLQVDGSSHYNEAIEYIKPLYDVDREIEKLRASYQWKRNMSDIQDFLSVDMQVDSMKKVQSAPMQYTEETEAQDPMAEMYAMDMYVDGGYKNVDALDGYNESDAKQIYQNASAEMTNDKVEEVPDELLQAQINGLSVEELLAVDREIEGAKEKRVSKNDTTGKASPQRRQNSRSIFSTKEKEAAKKKSITTQNEREEPATTLSETDNLSSRVSETDPRNEDKLAQAIDQIKETSSKRSIFSTKEKVAAVQKGKHWL